MTSHAPDAPEPRGMTLVDLAVLVAGCALFLALVANQRLWGATLPWMGAPPPLPLLVLYAVAGLLLSTTAATALAILARRFRYGTAPRPAEWVVLLITAHRLGANTLPDVDNLVNLLAVRLGLAATLAHAFSAWRWTLAAAGLGLTLALLAPLILRRTRWGAGTATLLSTAALVAWFWLPAPVCTLELPWLIPTLVSTSGATAGPGFLASLAFRQSLGGLPESLPLLMPVIAVLRRLPRGPRWTELVGLVAGPFVLVMVLTPNPLASGSWPEFAGSLAGLLLTVVLATFLSSRLQPAWNRLWTPPATRPPA